MTPEQITQWAREAGADIRRLSTVFYSRADLQAFAALVAAHEREECARECEALPVGSHDDVDDLAEEVIHIECVAAIRARK